MNSAHEQNDDGVNRNIFALIIYLVLGFAGLFFGARILVEGGVGLARLFDISEAVIGLTVMALGTSLPELAATVVAALRRQSGVAIGNIIGSNIFNIVGIVGVISIITPLSIPARVINIDVWVMFGATVLLMPYMIGRWTCLGRFGAFVFLLVYFIYIISIAYGVDTLLSR